MGKVAGKRVTFHASARIGAIAASLAAAAALLLPSTALAAPTEIGSAQGTLPCPTGFDSVQITSSNNSFVVPAEGTAITQWSVLAGPNDTGPVGLEVWALTPPPAPALTYTLIDVETDQTLTAGTLNTFTPAIPIAVTAGELIGLRVDGPLFCQTLILDANNLPSATDSFGFSAGATPAVGGTALMSSVPSFQLNIAASVDLSAPPPSTTIPTTTDQCKKGGWQGLTDTNLTLFKNQGDCVSFVTTGGTNLAG